MSVPSNIPPQGGAVANVAEVPSYLAEVGGDRNSAGGIAGLAQYVSPPRIKFMQPQSTGDLADKFRKGDIVTTPSGLLCAPVRLDANGRESKDTTQASEPFYLTPIFFYTEFICWNPYALRASLPTIRERSFDPRSEIARKAKNLTLSKEPCPEDDSKEIRYCEHLNFVVFPWYLEGINEPHILSFSRSSHKAGRKFCELIMSKKKQVMYAGRYECFSKFTKNEQAEWYSPVLQSPVAGSAVPPWVETRELFDWLKDQAEYFASIFQSGQLQVDHDDDLVLDGSATPASGEF